MLRLSKKYDGLQFFAPPVGTVYILTFDSSVYCKVNGVTKDSPYTLSNGDVITLTPNYIDFAVNGTIYSSSVANTIAISNSNINITVNSKTPTMQGPNSTINYTEVSTPRLSVDVSTLAGWANLSAGSHDITIVAKASGFKDSAPSAAVSVTKAASTKTLAAGTYKWKDAPSLPSNTIETVFDFINEDTPYYGVIVSSDALQYFQAEGGFSPVPAYTSSSWSEDFFKTITLATDQQVSADFYEWAITGGNLVKQIVIPAKGDIITLDSKQYRVLKTEGTVAEVLAMYDATTKQKFGPTQTYENSSLDTYCNTAFYNSLSSAMQNAIVAKTFQQDLWKWNGGTSALVNYAGTYQDDGTNNYTLSLMSTAFGSSISRKCYVLSCQDVIDYLGVTTSMDSTNTTLTAENVLRMFWNQITIISKAIWLRSADDIDPDYAFSVYGDYGELVSDTIDRNDNYIVVRPAFQIDLRKISWS